MKHDHYDLAEMRFEQVLERRYLAALTSNPDCRDPAHPGCERCVEKEDGDNESA